jgi:hypothetical protein
MVYERTTSDEVATAKMTRHHSLIAHVTHGQDSGVRGQVHGICTHHDSLLADSPVAIKRQDICASDHASWQPPWVATCDLFAPLDVALAPDPSKQCVAAAARIWENERLRVESAHPKIVGNPDPSVAFPLYTIRTV